MQSFELDQVRRWFAENLRMSAPIRRNDSVVEAFASVPRERFFGPGPWRILPADHLDEAYVTQDADPRRLYHDVLISIDTDRGLNNGLPRLWARILDHVGLQPGETVMQVGAGTGYYSALMAEIVGRQGRVVAVEYDSGLASEARRNLSDWPQVDVVHGDGTADAPGRFDAIIVFAGATHPAPAWLDALSDRGRLMLPLTAEDWQGFLLLAVKHGETFQATSLGPCGFIECVGLRDSEAATRLRNAQNRQSNHERPIKALHRGEPPPGERRVWYSGPGFWLSH